MRVAMILAGCGYLDGAEIRESVLSLLYLDEQGASVECFAPDMKQYHVVDHLTKSDTQESRNVLVEAARIARSDVQPLSALEVDAFDALLLPGGFGVAKNLSNLAFKGADAEVLPEYAEAIQAFHAAGKPIGAICIAPAVVALALKNKGVTLTIGEDAGIASVITASGNIHKNCATDAVVVDESHRIASCSAYMRDDALAPIARGIRACVAEVLRMASEHTQRKAS